jgi:hypothetical protein
MRKNFFSLAVIAVIFVLSSCSSKSSFESDVRKLANYDVNNKNWRQKIRLMKK